VVFFHILHGGLEGERWEEAVVEPNIGEQGAYDNVGQGRAKKNVENRKKGLPRGRVGSNNSASRLGETKRGDLVTKKGLDRNDEFR